MLTFLQYFHQKHLTAAFFNFGGDEHPHTQNIFKIPKKHRFSNKRFEFVPKTHKISNKRFEFVRNEDNLID